MPKSPSSSSHAFQPSVIRSLIKRIEALADQKASAHGSYMNRCGELQNDINAVLDEASRKNIPAKSLRAAIKVRAKRRTAEAVLAKLEADERAIVQTILEVNADPADLPLFKAASARAAAAEAEMEGAGAEALQ